MISHKTHCNQSTYFPLADLTFKFYVTVHDIEKTAQFDIWRELCAGRSLEREK